MAMVAREDEVCYSLIILCFILLCPTCLLFSYLNFRLQKLFLRKNKVKPVIDSKKNDDLVGEEEDKELYVERIRLETMKLRFVLFLACYDLMTAIFSSHIVLLLM
jgi:hypothetical protein